MAPCVADALLVAARIPSVADEQSGGRHTNIPFIRIFRSVAIGTYPGGPEFRKFRIGNEFGYVPGEDFRCGKT
jgi:hypothetical protein